MLRLALALVALCGTASLAADPSSVVVLPPAPASAKATPGIPEGLPLVIQERVNARLMGAKGLVVVHPRQVRAMAQRHRMTVESLGSPVEARSAAERVGAAVFAYSSLTPSKEGWSLEASVSRVGTPKTRDARAELPRELAKAVALAEKTVSELVLGELGLSAPPLTFPAEPIDAAVRDYASCAELLGRQPIGVEVPTVLNEGELLKAQGACERAVKTAPGDAEAWTALALVDAVAGRDEAAAMALTKAQIMRVSHHLPNLVLTRFWLAGRYQSSDAAAKVLKDALLAEPGFLLARAYLGELYNALGQHELAAQAWKDYAAVTRPHPFVISKLGYTLARLGRQEEAATFAEKAFAFDRESVDLSLELASRYVDAGQVEKAEAVLVPLAQAKDARGEVLLRLGYVRQKQGQAEAAEQLLTRAVAAAAEPSEWRTRARAKLNLAVLAAGKGKKDDARRFATEAAKEGLKLSATPETRDVVALFTEKELEKLGGGPKAKQASPLPLSGGEVDPSAKRAPAPKGL